MKDKNKKVSSVEWLFFQLPNYLTQTQDGYDMYQQAKAMHKQEIIDAFNESRLTHPMIGFKHETFEQYYNETFES